MSIRTDSIQSAVNDLSDARVQGADLNSSEYACVELDDGTLLRCVETRPGQWEAWTDDDRSWPL